jgi:hypothetical protein
MHTVPIEKIFYRNSCIKQTCQVFEYFSSVSRGSRIEDVEAGEEVGAEVDQVLVAAVASGLVAIVPQHTQQNKLHLKWKIKKKKIQSNLC